MFAYILKWHQHVCLINENARLEFKARSVPQCVFKLDIDNLPNKNPIFYEFFFMKNNKILFL